LRAAAQLAQLAQQHRQPALPASAPSVADQGGPLVIPYLAPVFAPDSTAAARVRAPHASSAWPACQGAPPGLFKATAAPRTSHPSRPSQPAVLRAAGNPNPRRRFQFPPPAPPHCQGARPETRKEVRDPPASLVFIPVHRVVRFSSPEFLAASLRRPSAPPRRRRHRSLRLLARCP
jgi:hypothetical protein